MRSEIKALIGAGALTLAFAGGIALAPSLVSGVAAQSAPQTDQTVDQRGPGNGHDIFSVAASYIGITVDQLRQETGSAKSLADVAVAHGKTRDGLIAALVTAETQNIQQRIGDLVDHKGAPQKAPGGPGEHFGFGVMGQPLQAAATYLGISVQDLESRLHSGQTLAQIASSTAGKSRDGLIAALVQSENAKVDQAVKDGKLTADQATKLKTGIQQHVSDLVDGKMPAIRVPFGPGFGPGLPGPRGPRPSPSASPGA